MSDDLHSRLLDSALRHANAAIDAAEDRDTETRDFEVRQFKQALEGARSLTDLEVRTA